MLKPEKIRLEDSNIALLGSDLEYQIKKVCLFYFSPFLLPFPFLFLSPPGTLLPPQKKGITREKERKKQAGKGKRKGKGKGKRKMKMKKKRKLNGKKEKRKRIFTLLPLLLPFPLMFSSSL